MRNRLKLLWACLVLLVGVIVLVALTTGGAVLLVLLVGCLAMMGAMIWMLMGASGGGADEPRL